MIRSWNPRPHGSSMALALASLLLLSGCAASPRLFVNPQADMTLYQKIAVVPFTNLSGEGFAAARVTRAFVTELVISNRFQILDPSLKVDDAYKSYIVTTKAKKELFGLVAEVDKDHVKITEDPLKPDKAVMLP